MKLKSFPRPATSVALLAAVLAVPALALPPGTDAEIRKRIAPIGQLRLPEQTTEAAAPQQTASRGPEQIYDTYCQACHANGVSGSPVLGNEEQWEPRIAKGMQTLYEHTYNGFNVMPARGTCMECSDEELRKTVDWMVAKVDPSAVESNGEGDTAAQ